MMPSKITRDNTKNVHATMNTETEKSNIILENTRKKTSENKTRSHVLIFVLFFYLTTFNIFALCENIVLTIK